MFIRKLKRICDVRGCRSRDTFSISMSREAGNTIIACRKCLKDALAEIERLYPEEKKVEEAVANAEATESAESKLLSSSASQNPPPSEMEAVNENAKEAVTGGESVGETVNAAEVTPSPQGECLPDGLNETVYSEDELLDGMTIKELKAFADEVGADVSKCKVKVDFIEAIKATTKEVE